MNGGEVMNENIWFDDVEQFLVCPRRYCIEKTSRNYERIPDEQKTRELMKLKFSIEKPVISADLFGNTLISSPDAIVPHGEVWKILMKKTARRFKKKYLLEAAFHGYVFSSNGYIISQVIVESPYFRASIDWKEGIPHLFGVIENIVYSQMDDPPVPKPVSQCKTCRHVLECTKILVKEGSLLAIHGLNSKLKMKLIEQGVTDLPDILSKDIDYISIDTVEKLRKKVTALLEDKVLVISQYDRLEEGVFLDIESHPLKDFDYLFGVLVDDKYIPYLCESIEDEYRVFGELLDFLDRTSGPIYHYCPYEPSRFSSLVNRWSDLGTVYRKIKTRFVDVYQILVKHIALPLFTYSLKSVARFLGYQWRTNLDGLRASRYYQLWLSTHDQEYLDILLKYNEDDTRATKLVVEKLNHFRNQKVIYR